MEIVSLSLEFSYRAICSLYYNSCHLYEIRHKSHILYLVASKLRVRPDEKPNPYYQDKSEIPQSLTELFLLEH